MMTETPPDISKCTVFSALSRTEIERKIDTLLTEEKPFKDVPLILAASGGSRRFKYREISVREWHCAGNVRFDAAVELLD
jgi:hypothetical protein